MSPVEFVIIALLIGLGIAECVPSDHERKILKELKALREELRKK